MSAGAAILGLVAGLAGVAAMTAAEKIEQRLTGRPGSRAGVVLRPRRTPR